MNTSTVFSSLPSPLWGEEPGGEGRSQIAASYPRSPLTLTLSPEGRGDRKKHRPFLTDP